MKRLKYFLFSCFTILFFVNLASAQDSIESKDAKNYEGKEVVVIGTVVETFTSKKDHVFLNIDEKYPNTPLTAVIFSKDYDTVAPAFNNSLINLKGKKVKLSGTVKIYKGRPEIILNSPNQISIVEEQ